MALRFVEPDGTTRLDLPGGDWIDVKTRLPFGTAEKMRSAALQYSQRTRQEAEGRVRQGAEGSDGTTLDISIGSFKIEKMVAYIVGWSARTPDGKPIKPTREAFAALDEDAAKEVSDALDDHTTRQEQLAKAAEGNPTETPIEGSFSLVGGSDGAGAMS